MNNQNKLWITVLILSVGALFLLACLPLEVHFGWDMPFVHLDHETLTLFGYKILGVERQLGFVMLSGIMMMLPVRTLHLAMIKLTKKKG
ncbi:MAG: hypothetical protein R3B65_04015 [Candidatus Paceibacterota bacterium]